MNMPSEPAVASFDFPSGPLRGTQLTLYGARLLHHGAGQMESIALGAIASVSVGYQRDATRIGWGVALAVAALLLFLLFRPLAAFATDANPEFFRLELIFDSDQAIAGAAPTAIPDRL